MKKWIKRVSIIVVLLVVGGIVIVYFSLNAIVRATVQSQATASLGVDTTLGSAALSIFGGSVQLNDLDVASPPNFSAPNLFTLGAVKVGVNYGQLRDQPIHISQIVITNPDLVVEQANGKLNLQALMDQLPKTPSSASGQSSQPMKLIIDRLEMQNANVTIRPGIPGLNSPISVTVPSLVMTNIGNADGAGNGAAIKDVIMQAATSLSAKGVDTANLPPEVKALLSGGINGLTTQLNGDVNQEIQNVAGSLNKSLNKSLGGGLNGILGGNKNGGPTTQSLEQGFGNLLSGKKQ